MASKTESSRRNARSDPYPTGWTDWKWSEEHQRNWRARELSKGEWEYDFAQPQTQVEHGFEPTLWTPRETDFDGLPRISKQSEQDEEPRGYQSYYGAESSSSTKNPDDMQKGQSQTAPDPVSVETERLSRMTHDSKAGAEPELLDDYKGYGGSSYAQTGDEKDGKRKEVLCPTCSMTFPQSSDLERHQKTVHLGARPYQCLIDGCTANVRSWNTAAKLRLHEKTWHNGDSDTDKSHTKHRSKDELNFRFQIHRSKEFEFGRVFKVLWSEPIGSGGTEITTTYSAKTFYKVRRFVIMRQDKGHSICIPILTYGYQGVLKPGVHPESHTVVHSSAKPYFLEGERVILTKRPIKVDINDPSEKLDPLSRLNYAKIYTIEHNVKVYFFGRVAKNCEQELAICFNEANPPVQPYPAAMPIPTASSSSSSGLHEPSPSYPRLDGSLGFTHPYGLIYQPETPPTAQPQPETQSYNDGYDGD
ncbi:hypothetical protein N431DRAFT_118062 [Stipitochalara longipes BDJ]|nr:hypothetical protein N431DRAFT_118062 [Stipitochalara longipes BDJ]